MRAMGWVLLLPAAAHAQPDLANAHTLIKQYCLRCHNPKAATGGVNLQPLLGAADSFATRAGLWNQAVSRVRDASMPPKGQPGPTPEARDSFTSFAAARIKAAACADGIQPPNPRLRRLTRNEYAATVRDLLNIHINAGHALPADGAGGEGFDNAAETLFLSPIHAEKYMDAAKLALDYARRDPRSRAVFLEPKGDARGILEGFLPRAFRRPARPGEVDRYLALFEAERKRGGTFDDAVLHAIQAVLMSPHFLFRLETGQYAIASRLSYFLWGSMPDKQLFSMAEQEMLRDPATLKCEIARMVTDVKATEFAERFVEQWLGTRDLGREVKPDPKLFAPFYDAEIQSGIKYEPIIFFQEVIAQNKPLLDFIDSKWTVMSNRLQRFYGLKPTPGIRQQPVPVDLPPDSHRGGLLGMAAVLAVSSHANRTSPVLRGKWVLESMLGTPPPPPPPNVPELPESHDAAPKSLRERLEAHRANPACSGCHNRMDPIGFGLENFDVIGRWRAEDAGKPVDARGQLPDGSTFDGPEQLKAVLMEKKELFVRYLASKLFGYALARGLTAEDQCAVDKIVAAVQADGFRAQTLVREIVLSEPFLYEPKTPVVKRP